MDVGMVRESSSTMDKRSERYGGLPVVADALVCSPARWASNLRLGLCTAGLGVVWHCTRTCIYMGRGLNQLCKATWLSTGCPIGCTLRRFGEPGASSNACCRSIHSGKYKLGRTTKK